ncbi:MAG TPA: putative sulfate exporter family transporter, partial [Gammaproteobacteria bacterium]|nr:putative sulfate exporter family transporter [Gammaproteobacteria bacterium]
MSNNTSTSLASGRDSGTLFARLALTVGIAFSLSPWSSPATALAAGMAMALTIGNPASRLCRPLSRYCLQAAVVLLGFEMNLHTVLATGMHGLLIAAATIAFAFGLGWLLSRLLRIAGRTSLLISAGTAICGGSA